MVDAETCSEYVCDGVANGLHDTEGSAVTECSDRVDKVGVDDAHAAVTVAVSPDETVCVMVADACRAVTLAVAVTAFVSVGEAVGHPDEFAAQRSRPQKTQCLPVVFGSEFTMAIWHDAGERE